jgi:hypothetical protein
MVGLERRCWSTRLAPSSSYGSSLLPTLRSRRAFLVPWGIDLPMAVGAIAMSLSTIIVATNAQLLPRLRLRYEPDRPLSIVPEPA